MIPTNDGKEKGKREICRECKECRGFHMQAHNIGSVKMNKQTRGRGGEECDVGGRLAQLYFTLQTCMIAME